MTPDDEPARSGYATETFFAGRAGGMVVSRYAVIDDERHVVGEMTVRVAVPGDEVRIGLSAVIAEGL